MQPADSGNALDNFWSLSQADLFKNLSATEKGLDSGSVAYRLKKYGPNTFNKSSGASALWLFLGQFKSPVTLLLIGAALLSLGLSDFSDALIILAIIMVSSILGFWQERGAANAVTELLKMVQIKCRLLREGKSVELPVEQVVPGDVVLLSAGDIIPGDGYILTSQELFVDEAAFTGETYPVEKNPGLVAADAPLAKRSNSVFMGSHITSGKATVMVVKTGRRTEFGKISDQLMTKVPETDFEKCIRGFGYMLMQISLVLVIIIFLVNLLLHKPVLDSFLFSLALAVGLTPQLLPAIITVNLSAGARLMARQNVIVKRLSSIENFGSMNILCSDKTGTVTDGKVTLNDALDLEGNHSDKTLEYAWLNASLQQGFHNPIDEAICDFKAKSELPKFMVQSEIPYDFIRKRLTVQVRNESSNFAITKGALNSVLDVCEKAEKADGTQVSISEKRAIINEQYKKLSAAGFRVLGVAYKPASNETNFTRNDEQGMVFIGFITLFDPPKKDAAESIVKLHNLGVQFKLITGDNELVAASLAKMIGIKNAVILTGKALHEMSDDALINKASKTDIFAEVEPNQKERIISLLKKGGNVVGFMGDGINDAPALHAADVGISVDTAVDVAKEAADIVLLANGLKVLGEGIIAGRKTFANTMKYIFMATSANFGNMFSMAGASLFLPFLPLLPKQILLTNLLTDFPQMTIASDRVDAKYTSKPHRWNIGFIKRFMVVFGLLSSVFDYITFGLLITILGANEKVFQTGWFVESVVSASLIVLVVRTRFPVLKSLPGKLLGWATVSCVLTVLALPFSPLANLFGFVALPWKYFGFMVVIVLSYLVSAEMAKKWFYRKAMNRN